VLAYFDRPGTSNGPTEAINGRLEHLRGSALGFRNLTHYIARSLLETGGFRPQLHPGMRWAPYVSGEISESRLQCKHLEMMRPDLLAQTWGHISTWLKLQNLTVAVPAVTVNVPAVTINGPAGRSCGCRRSPRQARCSDHRRLHAFVVGGLALVPIRPKDLQVGVLSPSPTRIRRLIGPATTRQLVEPRARAAIGGGSRPAGMPPSAARCDGWP
jgi:hypothetical protein